MIPELLSELFLNESWCTTFPEFDLKDNECVRKLNSKQKTVQLKTHFEIDMQPCRQHRNGLLSV